jgi:hypothetical protein
VIYPISYACIDARDPSQTMLSYQIARGWC